MFQKRLYVVLFFFSSRRRHTRSLRDWSSDVCSSDLSAPDGTYSLRVPDAGAYRLTGELIAFAPLSKTIDVERSACPLRLDLSMTLASRSEERRVGKECRSLWWEDHGKKEGDNRQVVP